jgi:hypothetical protein
MEIKNGDFAKFLEKTPQTNKGKERVQSPLALTQPNTDPSEIFDGEAFAQMLMDEEKMDEYAAQMRQEAEETKDLEPMSDEEFERQALEAGGADNDANTPE